MVSNRQLSINWCIGLMTAKWNEGNIEYAQHINTLIEKYENMTDTEFDLKYVGSND